MYKIRNNNFFIFLLRLGALYLLFLLCRVVFAVHNLPLLGAIHWSDIPSLLHGGFVFDSVSILYGNIPFIVFSLLPFNFIGRQGYQRMLIWLFVIVNAIALIPNVADIYYFPFKLGRLASDDWHYAAESGLGRLIWTDVAQYWWGAVIWAVLVAALVVVARKFRYKPQRFPLVAQPVARYAIRFIILALAALYAGSGVRGFVSWWGTFPIAMNDATLFVRPELSSVALSNPFCIIRTLQEKYDNPVYFDDQAQVDSLAPCVHLPAPHPKIALQGHPNVVFLILESFGSGNIGLLNPEADQSVTPNLDSLMRRSYLFTNAFHNGHRSIDALPSVWASIPSLRNQFLTLPQAIAEYYPLTAALRDMGYTTQFYHGGAKETMSFAAFGRMAGVEHCYSRDDYEQVRGSGDFDGTWGIYDDKFLPYVVDMLDGTPPPFCATIFTLSSHIPFAIPKEMKERFKQVRPEDRAMAYSDYAIGKFFEKASRSPWFDSTLFVLTADHNSSWAVGEKFRKVPGLFSIPIAFYYPKAGLQGRDSTIMQHINIAPTLQSMLGVNKPIFGMGRDQFNDSITPPYAIFFHNGMFNYLSDSTLYQSDGYSEPTAQNCFGGEIHIDSLAVVRMKAFIQQYYGRVAEKDYLAK